MCFSGDEVLAFEQFGQCAVPPTRCHAVETAMLIAAPCPRQQIYIEHRITSPFQGL